ncbi:MAG: hypothetical protein LAP21_11685 [Acidobacteriia bacterium]|nr:hypothetical protein [Terriglobia bacterium]
MERSDTQAVPAKDETQHARSSLFRQEALDSQEQKLYGDILLIRPLSLALLAWVGTGLAALMAAVLVWGEYTEKARVTGVLRATSGRLEAYLEVPARLTTHLHQGTHVPVICPSCPEKQWSGSTGTVSAISSLAPDTAEGTIRSTALREPLYRVVVALDAGPSLPEGTRIEADLPLERRPLLRWIFSRPAA